MHHCRVNWVNIKGTQYKRNDCIMTGFTHDEPKFARIVDIVFVESHQAPIFICELLTTVSYSSHYHSYEVVSNETYNIITLDTLVDHNVLSMYQTFQNRFKYYITLKYYIINEFD